MQAAGGLTSSRPIGDLAQLTKKLLQTSMKIKRNKAEQNEQKLINNSLNEHKALKDSGKQKTSKKEIWKFIKPYLYADGKRNVFYLAMA